MVEYNVKYGARVMTTMLNGEMQRIVFDDMYRIFTIKNDGDSTIYASFDDDIVPGNDGVYAVNPKTTTNIAFVLRSNYINIQGTGSVEVSVGNLYIPIHTGDVVTTGGGPGGDVEITTNEDVDELFKG